ncbi:MAG TPA: GDSL-type esterase/lipase family protein [Kiritimatiellia bacterium]
MIPFLLIVLVAAGYAWLPRVEGNLWNIAPALACFVLMGRLMRGPRAWWRGLLWTVLLFGAIEFGARCGGYHRTLNYERQGDLLFTPSPNQQCLEKISLSSSRINNLGLRGPDIDPSALKRRVILCLGDSITYGYGVADGETWPAQLQAALDVARPGEYLALNAGVNAYPVSFMHQKFWYLVRQGIRPDTVIVAYSMNEGWLGDLVESDEARKDAFERRVHLKNFLRSHAMYNLAVEKWGRAWYDRVKGHLVPGTHLKEGAPVDRAEVYATRVGKLLDDIKGQGSRAVVLVACSLNDQTGRYDSQGALQRIMADVAAERGVTAIRTDDILGAAAQDFDTKEAFIDASHMTPAGNKAVAVALAAAVAGDSPGR